MVKILALDTSLEYSSVSINLDNQVIAYANSEKSNTHAETLISMIENLLKNNNLDYKDIDHIAVNIGPGSFTGIRIGLSVAKGFRIATGKAICPVTSFESALMNIETNYTNIDDQDKYDEHLIILDGKKGQFFVNFAKDRNEYLMIDYADIENYLSQNKKYIIVTNAENILLEQIKEIKQNNLLIEYLADARNIGKVAYQKKDSNSLDNENDDISPLYIRFADAIKPNKNK